MKKKNLNRSLFYYYILKTDNSLQILNRYNKTYFKALLISYFGAIIPEIQNKQDFINFLQKDINDLLQASFKTSIIVILDKNISVNLSNKYVGKEIEFILVKEGNEIIIKNIVFEDIARNI